jgi:hypothetical protein
VPAGDRVHEQREREAGQQDDERQGHRTLFDAGGLR